MPTGILFAEKPCANAATDQTGPGRSSDDGPILVTDSLRNPDPAASAGWCPNLGAQWDAITVSTVAPTLATMIGLGVGIDYVLFIVTNR